MTNPLDRTAPAHLKENSSAIPCPCCGQPLLPGRLYSPAGQGVYWLPDSTEPSEIPAGLYLHRKNIEASGGIVLDEVSPVGFLAKDRPQSLYCRACRLFLTKCLP